MRNFTTNLMMMLAFRRGKPSMASRIFAMSLFFLGGLASIILGALADSATLVTLGVIYLLIVAGFVLYRIHKNRPRW